MHVHLVGNGSGGTGCWMRGTGWHRAPALFMIRHIGLPMSALSGDLDGPYAARVLELVRGSSLGGVVVLAHDNVYDEQGRGLEGGGSVYVPDVYLVEVGG